MTILTFQTYSVNQAGTLTLSDTATPGVQAGTQAGDFMTLPEIVTYIIAPILGALGVIGGIVKYVIPRIIDAHLESDKDARQYSQKAESLEQLNRLSNSAAAHQVIAELLASSQENEQRANEFIRTTVFNGIQDIAKRLAQLENRQGLLANLITGGKLDENEPIGDYDTWIKSKVDGTYRETPNLPGSAAGDNDE